MNLTSVVLPRPSDSALQGDFASAQALHLFVDASWGTDEVLGVVGHTTRGAIVHQDSERVGIKTVSAELEELGPVVEAANIVVKAE